MAMCSVTAHFNTPPSSMKALRIDSLVSVPDFSETPPGVLSFPVLLWQTPPLQEKSTELRRPPVQIHENPLNDRTDHEDI